MLITWLVPIRENLFTTFKIVANGNAGLRAVSVATVNLDVKLEDAGLLVLTQDAQVTAKEYPAHTVKTRTNIFVPEDLKVDAVLVLDTTNSMQGELNGVKAGLEKFIREQLDPSTSPTIALVGFKDDVKVLAFHLTSLELLQACPGLQTLNCWN